MHGGQKLIVDLRPEMVLDVIAEVDLAEEQALEQVGFHSPDEGAGSSQEIRRIRLSAQGTRRLVLGDRSDIEEQHLHCQERREPQEKISQRMYRPKRCEDHSMRDKQ